MEWGFMPMAVVAAIGRHLHWTDMLAFRTVCYSFWDATPAPPLVHAAMSGAALCAMPASAANTLMMFQVHLACWGTSRLLEPLVGALQAAPTCFFANKEATLSLSLEDFEDVHEHVVYNAIRSVVGNASELRVRVEISAGCLTLDGSLGCLLREASHVTHVVRNGGIALMLERMEGTTHVDAHGFPALRDLRLHVGAPCMAQLLLCLPDPMDIRHVTKLAIVVHGCIDVVVAAASDLQSVSMALCSMYWDVGIHNICITLPWDGAALPRTEWRSASQLLSYEESCPHPMHRIVRICARNI